MQYINTDTGHMIDVDSFVEGENWEPVEAPELPKTKIKTAAKKEDK